MKPSNKKTLTDALTASIPLAASETFDAEGTAAQDDAERCGILVRVSPELRRTLKVTAAMRDTTVQDLMIDAIAVVLQEPAAAPKP